jgi:hypothetical protein
MNRTLHFRLVAVMTALALVSLFTGCGATHARFTPT